MIAAGLIALQASCHGFQRVSAEGGGVLGSAQTLTELKQSLKHWTAVPFDGGDFDGVAFYSSIGSGIALTSVAVYAKSKKRGIWSLRAYQECNARKISIEAKGQLLRVLDVSGDVIVSYSLKYLDPALVK